QDYDCVYLACLVAALTQGRDLLARNVDKSVLENREDTFGDKGTSDFWTLIKAFDYAAANQFRVDTLRKLGIHALTARQVGPLFEQFLRIAKEQGLNITPAVSEDKDEALRRCILIGFSDRVGRMDEATLRCELEHGRRGTLARDSVVRHSPVIV